MVRLSSGLTVFLNFQSGDSTSKRTGLVLIFTRVTRTRLQTTFFFWLAQDGFDYTSTTDYRFRRFKDGFDYAFRLRTTRVRLQ